MKLRRDSFIHSHSFIMLQISHVSVSIFFPPEHRLFFWKGKLLPMLPQKKKKKRDKMKDKTIKWNKRLKVVPTLPFLESSLCSSTSMITYEFLKTQAKYGTQLALLQRPSAMIWILSGKEWCYPNLLAYDGKKHRIKTILSN